MFWIQFLVDQGLCASIINVWTRTSFAFVSCSLSLACFCEAQEIKQTPQLFAPIERFLRFRSVNDLLLGFLFASLERKEIFVVKTKDMIGFVGQGQKVVVVVFVGALRFSPQVHSFGIFSSNHYKSTRSGRKIGERMRNRSSRHH